MDKLYALRISVNFYVIYRFLIGDCRVRNLASNCYILWWVERPNLFNVRRACTETN